MIGLAIRNEFNKRKILAQLKNGAWIVLVISATPNRGFGSRTEKIDVDYSSTGARSNVLHELHVDSDGFRSAPHQGQ